MQRNAALLRFREKKGSKVKKPARELEEVFVGNICSVVV